MQDRPAACVVGAHARGVGTGVTWTGGFTEPGALLSTGGVVIGTSGAVACFSIGSPAGACLPHTHIPTNTRTPNTSAAPAPAMMINRVLLSPPPPPLLPLLELVLTTLVTVRSDALGTLTLTFSPVATVWIAEARVEALMLSAWEDALLLNEEETAAEKTTVAARREAVELTEHPEE